MITLDEITMVVGGRTLFEEVSCAFSPNKHYALTGPNGAGKSTLLKIMMDIVAPVKGKVSKPDRIGMLRQNIHDFLEYSAINVVIQGNTRLWKTLEERDRLYELEMTDKVCMKLGDLECIIAEEDGYSAESNAERLLLGSGVPSQYHYKQMKEIPQDMQFRALLCQALFGDPLALLLDEPTNHLDMESISWLEQFLQNYPGTLIVVSHDRHFLNAVATHIADIDYETVIIYPGNYDDMVEAKTAVRDRAAADAKSKEKKIAQLQEFVSRFRSGTRASQVQSRMREMEKLQPQDSKKSNIQRPYIRFVPMEKAAGKVTLQVQSITKAYGDHEVIKPFSLEIHRGDKIGVIGNNGRGKTTLLKMLAQVMPPDKGIIELGHNVVVSYFPQNHEEAVNKQDEHNLFEWLKSQRPNAYDQDIRSILGKMLFTGEDAFKKISALSGGETARLIIGSMTLCDHNVIILDEPNNHLDLEAVSALGWALDEYPGTAIVASHDRDLLARFAKKLIVFTDHGIELYDGTLEEYFQVKG